jgi:hypothetical protein
MLNQLVIGLLKQSVYGQNRSIIQLVANNYFNLILNHLIAIPTSDCLI